MKTKLLRFMMLAGLLCHAQVKVSVEKMIIPTYETKAPDKVPLFFRSEEVQLAERHIYPYPFYDVTTTDKVDKAYTAVILENEYLKICITPEMGGRIYYALDKTNGYNIVHYNHVVKPALIGTLGAWTSGGVEWNTPHHHRATSLLPVDYTIEENGDGSKTVWVGEYEKRSQTRWLVGLTLEPGKAYVKKELKSLNVTPFQYPALFFANVAVSVNDDYQFFLAPDIDMINFHYVTEFARWPVLNQVYQSVDYTHGEDLSWWKTGKQPASFFATNPTMDFMGGIDHGKHSGIVLVGDHRIFKGQKIWTWGKNEVQRSWDEKLTDADGPYAELMMGIYSDNQPDYNFLAPFETKYGTMYMYGIKGMNALKQANKDFVINLDLQAQQALIQVNATSFYNEVKIELSLKDSAVFAETVKLSPQNPYQKTVDIDGEIQAQDLKLAVLSPDHTELISWQKKPGINEPFPPVYQDPLNPTEYKTSQELFFAGLKLEQFGNTNFDYMKYYEAALQLDPSDVMTNTQLGTIYLKRGEYALAEEHLKRAVAVVTGNHKKAQDATSLYYLGLCYLNQSKIDEALDLLYRSTWDYQWTSAGYTLVARLEARRGHWEKAFDAADRACKANTQNVEALLAKAIILRKQGSFEPALRSVQDALAVDPLCFTAMNELLLLSNHIPTGMNAETCRASLVKHLRTEPYNYIETAARYSRFGLDGDAAEVMNLAAGSLNSALNSYPMVYYHLGMYLHLSGQGVKAEQALQKASRLTIDLCFPYGDESINVLRFAIAKNPHDATAHYLLGNALADHQHGEALKCWQQAVQLKPNQAIMYRNMAYLQANHQRNMKDALSNIMKAISLDPSEARYFAEAKLYMLYASFSAQQLADFLARYGKMAKEMTDFQLLEVKLNNYNGRYEKSIERLKKMKYHIMEGATFNPHVYWFDAWLQTGIKQMQSQQYKKAEQSFLKAMEFPANLEAERNGKIGVALYYLGVNSKRSGNPKQAEHYFTRMKNYTYSQGWGAGDFPELDYYKALALLELGGGRAAADEIFRKLISEGENRLAAVKDSRHITVSAEEAHSARIFLLENELNRKSRRVTSYYMQGLGYLGLGDKDEACRFFSRAMEIDPLSLDPKLMLEVEVGPN